MSVMEWTPEKLAILRAIFPDHTTQECAEILGATVYSIETKASRLKLRKSNEHLSRIGIERNKVLTPEEKAARAKMIAGIKYTLEPLKPGRVRYASKSGVGGIVK